MRVAALRGAVVLACATLMSCASTKPASVPPSSSSLPAPYDTKYEFRLVSPMLMDQGLPIDRMYWVGEDRLIFLAFEYESNGKLSLRPGLYLWSEPTGEVRRIAESATGSCYSNGTLSYFTHRDGRLIFAQGSLDAVRERDLGEIKLGMPMPQRVECREVPPGTVPPKLLPLPGGGFLEGRRLAPGGALPYLYYPQLDARPIELPINPLFTGISSHRYSEYTRSHIFKSSVFDRASKTTAVLQILPDGTIHKLALTDGPWSWGVRVPLPTARGWLLATPLDGVYLMRGAEIEKVSPGKVLDIAVSPDGCRAALKMHFGTANAIRPVPVYTVNVCEKGERR